VPATRGLPYAQTVDGLTYLYLVFPTPTAS